MFEYKVMEFSDFQRICVDFGVSSEMGYYLEAWDSRDFFVGFTVSGDDYLARVPELDPDHPRLETYVFRFCGRVFNVTALQYSGQATIECVPSLSEEERELVSIALVNAFCANGYFGIDADEINQMSIKWE